ncbi:MAG: recombination mediator RecR [Halanaerobium sp.]|nr:recombination mediator RecR [Halanaerobium sp.]
MRRFARPIDELVRQLTKLPGIGPKTAERLAFYILDMDMSQARRLADSIVKAKEKVRYCSICCNFTEEDPCSICEDERRDAGVICVVENPKDVLAMEKTGQFHGKYHVLHGSISPIDGIGPDQIRVKELLRRIQEGDIQEIIVATDPNVEGEATAMYLARLLKPLGVKVTRIAHGLPVGGDLEYADEVTLSKALDGRREIE